MSVASQLYQLQEIDTEIESNERTLAQLTAQLGESPALIKARSELASEQKHLEELKQQQRSLQWEVDDVSQKLAKEEEKLFSGRITNSKELSNLQHEVETMKAKRSKLEDQELDIMGQTETAGAKADALRGENKKVEAEWQSQQQKLSADIERIKTALSDLKQERQEFSETISPDKVQFYQKLREQKGVAVARVEQGRCSRCRILLASSELQRSRNTMVQCSSCGRILYIA